MKRPNLRMIGKKEGKYFQFKGPENNFNKIFKETFPNLKKKIQDIKYKKLTVHQTDWTRKENPLYTY